MPTTGIEDHNDIKLADGVTAYHGSPYEFEDFDLSKVGTGEAKIYGGKEGHIGGKGAEYGHGIYLTDSEDTANHYKEKLSKPGQGYLYEVSIAPEKEKFLNWEKKLSEQDPFVRDALINSRINKKVPPQIEIEANYKNIDPLDHYKNVLGSTTGEQFYKSEASMHGDTAKASSALNKLGIPGIIVSHGEKSNSYVVFDPKHIKTVRRYAEGGGIKAYFMHAPQDFIERAKRAYGGAIYTPELQGDPDDIARRLILWSYAAAPLGRPLARAEGGAIDDPVNKAASIVGAPASAQNAVDIARNLTPMGFYSAAAEAASKFPQKAPIDQIISKIKGQPNVKTAELDNANLKDAFAGQRSVDPQEVARHLQANVPQISEKVYGGKPAIQYKPKALLERPKGFENTDDVYEVGPQGKPPHLIAVNGNNFDVWGPSGYHNSFDSFKDAVEYANQSIHGIEPTQYHEYTIPGGENYREVVMHTSSSGLNSSEEAELNDLYKKENAMTITKEEGNRMQSLIDKDRNTPIFHSSHWQGIDNPLAHLRMSDRDNGKTLHLEELQSDWGQEGRKKGFKGKFSELPADRKVIESVNAKGDPIFHIEGPNGETETAREYSRQNAINSWLNNRSSVPSAPYVTDTNQWVDLGLKRALMEAAKGGYDKLIWTPGEQQAARYDLSKQIDRLIYNPENEFLSAFDKNGKQVIMRRAEEKELADLVGKDVAKNLLASEARQLEEGSRSKYHVLEGQDLSVGGEGMKSFYDKLVPQRLSKLVSQYDKDAKIALHSHLLSGQNGEVKAHSIQITPKLRAAILKGLPAFRSGGDVSQSPIIDRAFKVLSKFSR